MEYILVGFLTINFIIINYRLDKMAEYLESKYETKQ